MGKKSLSRTRSGRYINPTEQYRKYIKQKESKRNKQQRTSARNNPINGKDPHQILNELEELDNREFDLDRLDSQLVFVWREKRKKLRENFDKIIKFLEKEDTFQCENLKNLLQIYEIKRSQRELAFERAKMAQDIPLEEIPIPESIEEPIEEFQEHQVSVPEETERTARTQESEEEFDLSDFESTYGDPPAPPPGSPPVISSEEEDESRNEYWLPYQEGGQFQQYPATMPASFIPHHDEAYYIPQQNLYPQSFDQPYSLSSYNPPVTAYNAPKIFNYEYGGHATIEAKPKLRNLREAATCFTPTVLKVHRQYKDAQGRLIDKPKSKPMDPLEVTQQESESKELAYEQFMEEIKDLI